MTCSRCGVAKTPEDFYAGDRRCRECKKQLASEYRARYPERRRDQTYRALYGISLAEYDEMVEDQNGRCRLCLVVPEGRLCVDHDHETGVVRGLLCKSCNSWLGRIGEDRGWMLRAWAYLEQTCA